MTAKLEDSNLVLAIAALVPKACTCMDWTRAGKPRHHVLCGVGLQVQHLGGTFGPWWLGNREAPFEWTRPNFARGSRGGWYSLAQLEYSTSDRLGRCERAIRGQADAVVDQWTSCAPEGSDGRTLQCTLAPHRGVRDLRIWPRTKESFHIHVHGRCGSRWGSSCRRQRAGRCKTPASLCSQDRAWHGMAWHRVIKSRTPATAHTLAWTGSTQAPAVSTAFAQCAVSLQAGVTFGGQSAAP